MGVLIEQFDAHAPIHQQPAHVQARGSCADHRGIENCFGHDDLLAPDARSGAAAGTSAEMTNPAQSGSGHSVLEGECGGGGAIGQGELGEDVAHVPGDGPFAEKELVRDSSIGQAPAR